MTWKRNAEGEYTSACGQWWIYRHEVVGLEVGWDVSNGKHVKYEPTLKRAKQYAETY